MKCPEGERSLLNLFWKLADASPERRVHAACSLVRYLICSLSKEEIAIKEEINQKKEDRARMPGVPAIDAHKMQDFLYSTKEGFSVPYELKYSANRLVRV